MRKLKFAMFLILCFSQICLHTETIIDTLYSLPYLDGGIKYSPGLNYYAVDTTYGNFLVGDYYSQYLWDFFFNRGFVAFELPNIPIGYFLDNVDLNIFQSTSAGNGINGQYPIFNMQTSIIEPPCFIEHLDYGYSLDESDFFLTPLHFIGTISNLPEAGWRTIEVTEFVLDDIENVRPFTQYRVRLALNTDNDPFLDALFFLTGNSSQYTQPYITYRFEEHSNISNEDFPMNHVYLSNYPNPFNPSTTISFDLQDNQTNPVIEILNIKGKIIKIINCLNRNEVEWNGTNNFGKHVSSGVYLYKLKSNNKVLISKKMLLLK